MENLRIKTNIGLNDVFLKVKLEQNFENLEILSLKIEQDKLYQTFCSDYGVVCGRVITNDGFGIPNAKLSIFIPISEEDEQRNEIMEIYPFKTPFDKNEITKVRYNLLPENKQKAIHEPVGTFPKINKIVANENYIEVYEKYYKFTTRTNNAGDYMLFGVPTGLQTIHMDVDVSDIENLSLNPETFIGNGFPEEFFDKLNGILKFKVSTNLDELPQIVSQNISVNVQSFWGDSDNCDIGITRQDFDITSQLSLNPIAVIFGQALSGKYPRSQYTTEGGNRAFNGNCNAYCGPVGVFCYDKNQEPYCEGKYGYRSDLKVPVSVSVDIYDENNNFFKTQTFEDGKIIISLPMTTERYITDEFGNAIISKDPTKGIPTKSKYWFNFYVNKLVGENSNTAEVSNKSFVRTANYIPGNVIPEPIDLEYDIFNRQIQFYNIGTKFATTLPINQLAQKSTLDTNIADSWFFPQNSGVSMENFLSNIPFLIGGVLTTNNENFLPGNLTSYDNGSSDVFNTLVQQTQNGILYFHVFEVKDNTSYFNGIANKIILSGNIPNFNVEFVYFKPNLDISITNVTNDLKLGLPETSNVNGSSTERPLYNTFNGKYFYFGREKNQTILQKLKEQFDGQI